jgi:hypothetical protein
MPRINSINGGFIGGIPTKYHSSFPSKFPREPTYDTNPTFESQDKYDNQPPSYPRNPYYKQRSRSPSYGNVKFLEKIPFEAVSNKKVV